MLDRVQSYNLWHKSGLYDPDPGCLGCRHCLASRAVRGLFERVYSWKSAFTLCLEICDWQLGPADNYRDLWNNRALLVFCSHFLLNLARRLCLWRLDGLHLSCELFTDSFRLRVYGIPSLEWDVADACSWVQFQLHFNCQFDHYGYHQWYHYWYVLSLANWTRRNRWRYEEQMLYL